MKRTRTLEQKMARRKVWTCKICSSSYSGGHSVSTKWCNNCRYIKCVCLDCQKEFLISRRWIKRGKFCSRDCAVNFNLKAHKKFGKDHYCWKGGVTSNRKSYLKEHRNNNREKYCFYSRIRIYRKKNALGSHTLEQWQNLKKEFGYMCLCCKRSEPEIKLTEDHIVPLIKGGSNNIDNIQPLCRSCNSRKHTTEIDFISQFYEVKQYEL